MKIIFIIKQSGSTKIIADSASTKPSFFFQSKAETDNPAKTLEYFMENAKKLDDFNKKPIVKERDSSRYYFMLSGENAYGFVTDTKSDPLNPAKIGVLFEKIIRATDTQQLQQLILDPDKAAETKIEKVSKQIQLAKTQVAETLDKMTERGQKIEVLSEKANNVSTTATKFKKSSVNMKKSLMPWYTRLFSCIISEPWAYMTSSSTFSSTPTPNKKIKTTISS